jgi:hypothetical protein
VTGFADLATKLSEPATTEITTAAQIEEIAAQEPVQIQYVLGTTGDSADMAKATETYKGMAKRFHDELAFKTTTANEALALFKKGKKVAAEGVSKPFIVKSDGKEAPTFINMPYLLEIDSPEGRIHHLGEWINDQKFPLVTALDGGTFYGVSHGSRLLMAAIVDAEDKDRFTTDMLRLARPGSVLGAPLAAKFHMGVMVVPEDKDEKERFEKFLAGYGVNMRHLPNVLALDFRVKDAQMFYNEQVRDTAGIPAFAQGVADGSVRPQYEGFWGAPDRWWRFFKGFLPFLAVADGLPTYTFSTLLGLLLLYGFIQLLMLPVEDEDEAPHGDKYKKDE